MKLPETRAPPGTLQALERLQNCAPEDRASQEAEVRRHLSLVSELASAEANHWEQDVKDWVRRYEALCCDCGIAPHVVAP